ncbi:MULTISPECIES: TetR/AcrR family transcriptional regulator [Brevibacillus]|uniref:TetR/AcrR family transcriptional regulator n=1 Tax=Brevibacillus TaxID=55080 RepID=UPI002041723F|nr:MULTISPECIES: TetR/AcrR family transcriptional regulator [Brevibacillus]MCM3080626.1 TetR/AcrR family transcriptional regulator [Brevibacillus invocatus]MCM3430757.1 TetR/AcrR family transcriptional regulator [Brevibacillus invocatus]MDH4618967.1 TetR/AcrR family transcriptional regulator [Brevibacillus sp. AY1]
MKKSSEKLPSRKLRSLETRKKLLAAGREQFIESGFQKTTIAQIIKKANTGYGTAYVHFKGKDDLLMQLMEEVMDRFYEIAELPFKPQSKQEAYDIIEKQAILFLEMANEERSMMQVIEEAIRLSEDVNRKWKDIRERFIKRIAQDIAYSQANGLARSDVDHNLVARGWFFANEMYLWEIVKNEYGFTVEEIAHNLTAVYTGGIYG